MRNRRFQIFVFPGPVALLAFLVHGIGTVGAAELPRPNILLIMADDLGYSDLGCYGGEIETPHLDRLAENGLRFRHFHNQAKCHTSRVSLMSGLYPFQGSADGKRDGYVNARGAALAEVAKSGGYFTAASGKWEGIPGPFEAGFDRFFGFRAPHAHFHLPRTLNPKGHLAGTYLLDNKAYTVPEGEPFYATDAITDHAISFIDQAVGETKPFFTYVAYNAPHYPVQARKEDVRKYLGRYRDGWNDVREARLARQRKLGILPPDIEPAGDERFSPEILDWDGLSEEEKAWQDSLMASYAGMVDRMDHNIGRLVAHLAAKGQLENTLIFFCSDNGACHETMSAERAEAERDFPAWDSDSYLLYGAAWARVSNTPFLGFKAGGFLGGFTSPGIVYWPAGLNVEPGTLTEARGHLIDWMPTLIELIGGTYPEERNGKPSIPPEGVSLTPVFRGEALQREKALFFHWGPCRALIDGDWGISSLYQSPFELYDLGNDPGQNHNLAERHPEKLESLTAEWWRVAREVNRSPESTLRPNDQRVRRFDPILSKKGEERK